MKLIIDNFYSPQTSGFTPLEFLKNFIRAEQKNQKTLTGFTLIELLVVIAILTLAAGMVMPNFNFFQRQNTLDIATQEIINTLRLAQNRTIASEGATNYGVYFAPDRFTLFTGQTFNPGAATNQEHVLNPSLLISQINLTSSSTVAFERLTGLASGYGSIRIQIASDASKNKTIYIGSNGIINLTSSSASDNNRVKDSRHTHVLYSQNAQNASTLSLNWSADGVTENIDFQTYLNAGRTEFNWEGTIDVNGSPQQLKIHTHSLTGTAALFCFHRDRRFNSKAVNISLDSQNLINYSAAGTTTPGASIWVGEPELQ